jgi:hypothetical protein
VRGVSDRRDALTVRLGRDGAVTALLLGLVEQPVGASEQILRRLGVVPLGDACRAGLAVRGSRSQSCDHGTCRVERAVEQQAELLASEPREEISGTQFRVPGGGARREHTIAVGMTVAVVERLEVIEIDHSDGDRAIGPQRRCERCTERVPPRPTVRQAGLRVCSRQTLEARQQLGALREQGRAGVESTRVSRAR